MMYQYRIAKYDPGLRNSSGAYAGDDWTALSDVGATFGGVVLTPERYLAVENSYVESAISFLAESEIQSLEIANLENHGQYANSNLAIAEGTVCSLLEIADIVRLNLRSLIWCRLVGDDAFLHFGYDFYMYVGVSKATPKAIESLHDSGLFVERFSSPYFEV